MRNPLPFFLTQKTMKKTYVSTRTISLNTSVIDKNGKAHQIAFEHGTTTPFVRYGKFSTTDPIIQEALEKDGGFNRLFALESVEETKKAPAAPAQGSDGGNKDPENNTALEEITTVAQARDYLVGLNDGLTKTYLKNKEVVLEEAGKRGITFPNLG